MEQHGSRDPAGWEEDRTQHTCETAADKTANAPPGGYSRQKLHVWQIRSVACPALSLACLARFARSLGRVPLRCVGGWLGSRSVRLSMLCRIDLTKQRVSVAIICAVLWCSLVNPSS
jgi:hypothetical protein